MAQEQIGVWKNLTVTHRGFILADLVN